ncbi:hypothetical protein [Streptomyces sp. NPDC089795]
MSENEKQIGAQLHESDLALVDIEVNLGDNLIIGAEAPAVATAETPADE